jgi:hypothetical protein
VLALPILLFVMALMINAGTGACWKLRSLSVARHTLWANRPSRNLKDTPRPACWPLEGTNSTSSAGKAAVLDDSRVNLPVARGPLPCGTMVRDWVLDPSRGLVEGHAALERPYAMFGEFQKMNVQARTELLDDKWQFWRIVWGEEGGSQYGLHSNTERRIPVLYELPLAPAELSSAYLQAALAIMRAPFHQSLRPLDRDEEDYSYRVRFGWPGLGDFQPRLSAFCSTDREVAQQRVDDVVKRIQGGERGRPPGVPKDITRGFLRMYQWVKQLLENLPPEQQAAAQAEIAELQAKIATLQAFLATLP